MRYRYLDDFRRGISVFAIFSYGIAVLGTPQCPPPTCIRINFVVAGLFFHNKNNNLTLSLSSKNYVHVRRGFEKGNTLNSL